MINALSYLRLHRHIHCYQLSHFVLSYHAISHRRGAMGPTRPPASTRRRLLLPQCPYHRRLRAPLSSPLLPSSPWAPRHRRPPRLLHRHLHQRRSPPLRPNPNSTFITIILNYISNIYQREEGGRSGGEGSGSGGGSGSKSERMYVSMYVCMYVHVNKHR